MNTGIEMNKYTELNLSIHVGIINFERLPFCKGTDSHLANK